MACLGQGQSWSGEIAVRRRDGTSFLSLVTDSPLRDASGVVVGAVGVSVDITTRAQADDAQSRLAAIVTSSADAMIAMTLDGTITDWNRGAEAVYGYTAAEMIGRSVSLLMQPEQLVAQVDGLRAGVLRGEHLEQFETVRLHKDGHSIDMSISITPIRARGGAIIGAASIGTDITERKAADSALIHQALHDGLTGLPNRSLLHTRLKQASRPTAEDADHAVALLLLDLDRFKEVNDTLGHHGRRRPAAADRPAPAGRRPSDRPGGASRRRRVRRAAAR